jgi:hypothetical protein
MYEGKLIYYHVFRLRLQQTISPVSKLIVVIQNVFFCIPFYCLWFVLQQISSLNHN